MKAAWKFIKVDNGGQFAMTLGAKLMLTWCAANWDIPTLSHIQQARDLVKGQGQSG